MIKKHNKGWKGEHARHRIAAKKGWKHNRNSHILAIDRGKNATVLLPSTPLAFMHRARVGGRRLDIKGYDTKKKGKK